MRPQVDGLEWITLLERWGWYVAILYFSWVDYKYLYNSTSIHFFSHLNFLFYLAKHLK